MTASHESPAENGLRQELRRTYCERAEELLAFAVRLTGSEATAEDVVHESVLRLLDGRCRVNPRRGDMALLLFGVVRNVAREQRRQQARDVQERPEDLRVTGEQPERGMAVRAALAALSTTDREVIILWAYHGYSPREIATVLGHSSLVIRVRLHRARARLRRFLNEGDGRLSKAVSHLEHRP